MTAAPFSLVETQDLTLSEIETLFSNAQKIKSHFIKTGEFCVKFKQQEIAALLFFEASTRTRFSFDMAIQRMGGRTSFFDGASKDGTSLIKGETFEDTFWTLHSMLPSVIVVRCGNELDLKKLARQSKVPLVNAGLGTDSHPTQALLDAFTMRESYGSLEGKKVLFVGDVSHSRVARSNLALLPRLGAQVGLVGPASFMTDVADRIKTFAQLTEALPWADVVVGLRVQFERHGSQIAFSREDFISQFQINSERGKLLKKEALLLHPGPVNWGVEFDPSVRDLPQFKMWDQKQNGVFVRAALIDLIFEKNGR